MRRRSRICWHKVGHEDGENRSREKVILLTSAAVWSYLEVATGIPWHVMHG